MLVGGGGLNSVAITADVNFTLTNSSIALSNGESIGLSGVTQAALTSGPSNDSFDVTGWTGSGSITGGGGFDTLISTVDADAVLTDTSLTRTNGASLVLAGIAKAIISGGASSNKLDATGFSGTAWLYGGAGNDTLVAGSGSDYLDGGTASIRSPAAPASTCSLVQAVRATRSSLERAMPRSTARRRPMRFKAAPATI